MRAKTNHLACPRQKSPRLPRLARAVSAILLVVAHLGGGMLHSWEPGSFHGECSSDVSMGGDAGHQAVTLHAAGCPHDSEDGGHHAETCPVCRTLQQAFSVATASTSTGRADQPDRPLRRDSEPGTIAPRAGTTCPRGPPRFA